MRVTLLVFILIISTISNAQDAESFYKIGLTYAQKGEPDKALEMFDKSIALKGDEYVAWYNRAIVKTMLKRYEDALADLQRTIQLNPGYKKAYFNRGLCKKHLADYTGAMEDFTVATQLDTGYGEAYFNRGLVYELFEKQDLACADFKTAKAAGYKPAAIKVVACADTNNHRQLHSILWLRRESADKKYGFVPERPIKVGTGPDGGQANVERYLDLLRDPKGNPVAFESMGTCCGFASEHAPNGLAMLDKYKISFKDEEGNDKSAFIYLSTYDYEEPLILAGFTTVRK